MNGGFEAMFVGFIDDRIKDLPLQSEYLDIQSQRFGFEEIWFSMFATALMNDLDRVHPLFGQTPHRVPRSMRRIGLDCRALAEPGILTVYGGCGMTARSSER